MDGAKLVKLLQEMRELKEFYADEYEVGLLHRDYLDNELSRLHDMFDEGLCQLGLRRSRPLTNASLMRYSEDYGLWARGRKPDSSAGEPWLLSEVEDSSSNAAASAEERAAYFQLAREALVEIFTQEIPPDDLEKPERYRTSLGARVTVLFNCVDDDGLMASEDPRGQRFVLVDSRGLRAEIVVDARAGYEYRPMWEKGSQYHGLISVEGYTVPGLHSTGVVDIRGGRVEAVTYNNYSWLSSCDDHVGALCTPEEYNAARRARKTNDGPFGITTAQGERNEEAFRSFPRWQSYFEWLDEHPRKLLSPSHEEYIDAFLHDRENSKRD